MERNRYVRYVKRVHGYTRHKKSAVSVKIVEVEPPLSRATNSIHLSRKKLTSFPGSLSYPSRSIGTGTGEPWDRSEVGKKLGNYGDDSGEPVKLFFFSVSFFFGGNAVQKTSLKS